MLVWDLPTRLFHWLAVGLVLAAYVTLRLDWMAWRRVRRRGAARTAVFPPWLGAAGNDSARFARFLVSPRAAVRYLARLFRREPDEQVGHNPAGGWMVLLPLALLLGETLTGIVVNNDVADAGPLTELMPAKLANLITDLHALLWDALLAAMALHVAAIVVYAVAKGHHLLRPMVTGRKRLPAQATAPRLASPALALLVLGGSAAAAALLTSLL